MANNDRTDPSGNALANLHDDVHLLVRAAVTNPNVILAAHATDTAHRLAAQQLHDHPDLAALDADLDHIVGQQSD